MKKLFLFGVLFVVFVLGLGTFTWMYVPKYFGQKQIMNVASDLLEKEITDLKEKIKEKDKYIEGLKQEADRLYKEKDKYIEELKQEVDRLYKENEQLKKYVDGNKEYINKMFGTQQQ